MRSALNVPAPVRAPLPPELAATLSTLLGERFSVAGAVREHHGRDESHLPAMTPDAVAWPLNTDEVAAIARACHAHRVPMVAWGAGSSVEGNALSPSGGVCIDTTRMDAVVSLNAEDMDVTVQAGLTRKALNARLRDTGLFFPLDPGADATLGGMAATRASGTNAVRYGTMRDNVLALTAVLADGTVFRSGTRSRKSSAGYDLTRLLVGSEGTLALITEVTVRLWPQPEAVSAAMCQFANVRAAVECVIAVIQAGVPIARCELLDTASIRAINAYAKTRFAESPMLLFEFHASATGVAEQAQSVQALAVEHGGAGFEWASSPEERTRLWTARHNAYFSALNLRPGCRVFSTDVCVPISRLADCIEATEADVTACGLPTILLGHVGDGNFHLGINFDPSSPDEVARAHALSDKVAARAIALGGTCTGEHGIGLGKLGFMQDEHGAALQVMRSLKAALDPHNLLNPGKVLPG